jgi:large subunit ribosomal protein L10
VARILVDFAKANPALKVKGGFTSDKWLTPEDCKRLSAIGSKTELVAQLASLLYSNLAQIRFVLEAPTRDLACVLDALKEKKAKESK